MITPSPSPAGTEAPGLLAGYPRPGHAHDEFLDPSGRPRPHWHGFVGGLRALGLPAFARRWRAARRLIRQNGVTYNVYGDLHGRDRPWQLDPVPLLIDPAEAASVRKGLVQRARL